MGAFNSTGNLVFVGMNLKPARPAALKNFVFDAFPSLRSLPFSEFGRFEISNETRPKSLRSSKLSRCFCFEIVFHNEIKVKSQWTQRRKSVARDS